MSSHHCDPCARDFEGKEALEMHHQAKHLSKEEAHAEAEKARKRKNLKKKAAYAGVLAVVLLVLYGLTLLFQGGGTYSQGQVHWHADLRITVCGKDIPLPKPIADGSTVHGESFVGTPFMHLHHEPKIHIEGTIKSAEDIRLRKFMEVIDMKFTDTELLDKKNGDDCDGEEGRVKLLVNGVEDSEVGKQVIKDGESYEIVFG